MSEDISKRSRSPSEEGTQNVKKLKTKVKTMRSCIDQIQDVLKQVPPESINSTGIDSELDQNYNQKMNNIAHMLNSMQPYSNSANENSKAPASNIRRDVLMRKSAPNAAAGSPSDPEVIRSSSLGNSTPFRRRSIEIYPSRVPADYLKSPPRTEPNYVYTSSPSGNKSVILAGHGKNVLFESSPDAEIGSFEEWAAPLINPTYKDSQNQNHVIVDPALAKKIERIQSGGVQISHVPPPKKSPVFKKPSLVDHGVSVIATNRPVVDRGSSIFEPFKPHMVERATSALHLSQDSNSSRSVFNESSLGTFSSRESRVSSNDIEITYYPTNSLGSRSGSRSERDELNKRITTIPSASIRRSNVQLLRNNVRLVSNEYSEENLGNAGRTRLQPPEFPRNSRAQSSKKVNYYQGGNKNWNSCIASTPIHIKKSTQAQVQQTNTNKVQSRFQPPPKTYRNQNQNTSQRNGTDVFSFQKSIGIGNTQSMDFDPNIQGNISIMSSIPDMNNSPGDFNQSFEPASVDGPSFPDMVVFSAKDKVGPNGKDKNVEGENLGRNKRNSQRNNNSNSSSAKRRKIRRNVGENQNVSLEEIENINTIEEELGIEAKTYKYTRNGKTYFYSKRYKCPHCPNVYVFKGKLREHVNAMHKNKKLQCEKCEASFNFASNLRAHILNKHNNNGEGFFCRVCNEEFENIRALKAHRSTHAHEVQHKCPNCKFQFTTIYTIKNNVPDFDEVEESESGNIYRCETCEFNTLYRSSYIRHIKGNSHKQKVEYNLAARVISQARNNENVAQGGDEGEENKTLDEPPSSFEISNSEEIESFGVLSLNNPDDSENLVINISTTDSSESNTSKSGSSNLHISLPDSSKSNNSTSDISSVNVSEPIPPNLNISKSHSSSFEASKSDSSELETSSQNSETSKIVPSNIINSKPAPLDTNKSFSAEQNLQTSKSGPLNIEKSKAGPSRLNATFSGSSARNGSKSISLNTSLNQVMNVEKVPNKPGSSKTTINVAVLKADPNMAESLKTNTSTTTSAPAPFNLNIIKSLPSCLEISYSSVQNSESASSPNSSGGSKSENNAQNISQISHLSSSVLNVTKSTQFNLSYSGNSNTQPAFHNLRENKNKSFSAGQEHNIGDFSSFNSNSFEGILFEVGNRDGNEENESESEIEEQIQLIDLENEEEEGDGGDQVETEIEKKDENLRKEEEGGGQEENIEQMEVENEEVDMEGEEEMQIMILNESVYEVPE